MTYENATLKIQIHQLTQNIEKLKSQMQKPKKINVDAKIIEKLSTQSDTRYVIRTCTKITTKRRYLIINLLYKCIITHIYSILNHILNHILI